MRIAGPDPLPAADLAISRLGLKAVRSTEYNSEIPAGTVISQDPLIGTKLSPCQGDVIIITSLGPIPTSAPPTETPVRPQSEYTVHMFNVDDTATLYINENLAYKAKWGQSGVEGSWNYFGHKSGDSGEIGITSLLKLGENFLRFELWNESVCCGVSLSIEIKEDGKIIASDVFSMQDSSSGIKYKRRSE